MKLKYLILVFVFLISFTSANLGTVAQDECMNIRVLANCSAINLSEVTNKDQTFVINDVMTKVGQTFNYSFCNTSVIGTYSYSWNNFCVDCSTNACGNSFEVTYNGDILTIENSMLQLGLMVILSFLFILIVVNIKHLPSSDIVNEEGILLGINNLKYLRPVLMGISWTLLLALVFMTSNVAIAHLPGTMFGQFFFVIYRIMFLITLPMVFVWFLYIFAKIFRDREIKRLIDRGVEIKGDV